MESEKTKDSEDQEEDHLPCVLNWEEEHRIGKDFSDDGTFSYFWRSHKITALVIFAVVLIYVAVLETPSDDPDYNFRRGLGAVVLAFLVFGVLHTPDGPFMRPHPVMWRLILVIGVLYELFLIFLLFQTPDYGRKILKYVDPQLGVPLPEKSYGGSCSLYDPDHTEDPFHMLWDKMDVFVPVHFFGWWLKTLILRDYWLCQVLSFMFEILEYTLEHQLPNFSECWWDHWIMDFLVCNWLGIHLGMKTLHYLGEKSYNWRGLWNIPTYRGKIRRIALQFSPHTWTEFDWKPTRSLRRWVLMLGVIAVFLIAELNTFYLKFVFFVPPDHTLCGVRLFFLLVMGAVSMRETLQFMDDPTCKQFGRQSWVMLVNILTECLLVCKYDWELVTGPLPVHVVAMWSVGLAALITYTFWKFYLHRHELETESAPCSQPSSPRRPDAPFEDQLQLQLNGSPRVLRSRTVLGTGHHS